MKKALAFVAMLVMVWGMTAFAGPFVGFDFIIPDDGTLYFGVESGPLTLEWSVCDLFLGVQSPPMLSFSVEHFTEFAYSDSEYQYWIEEIDFVTNYPVPVVGEMGFSWRGTLHVGDLAAMLAEPPPGEISFKIPNSMFDIYGEVSFEYDLATSQLVPTGSIGFYWEP